MDWGRLDEAHTQKQDRLSTPYCHLRLIQAQRCAVAATTYMPGRYLPRSSITHPNTFRWFPRHPGQTRLH